MNKSFAILGLATGLALFGASSADALPLNTVFQVTTWEGDNPVPGQETNPTQQALPSAISGLQNLVVTNFTYTGNLSFARNVAPNSISAFIASGGGSTVGTVPTGVLSNSNFTDTTLFRFRFTTTSTLSGVISHDDGVSLFVSDTPDNLVAGGVNLLPGAAVPTSLDFTDYSIGPGTYDLFYSEVNGLPAVLNFDVSSNVEVPEPASMALLGAGLIGVGIARRRRANRSVAV